MKTVYKCSGCDKEFQEASRCLIHEQQVHGTAVYGTTFSSLAREHQECVESPQSDDALWDYLTAVGLLEMPFDTQVELTAKFLVERFTLRELLEIASTNTDLFLSNLTIKDELREDITHGLLQRYYFNRKLEGGDKT